MDDNQIKILQNSLKKNQIIWSPDSQTAHRVSRVSTHVEEGDELCAIFENGQYAALYNADLVDFYVIESLGLI